MENDFRLRLANYEKASNEASNAMHGMGIILWPLLTAMDPGWSRGNWSIDIVYLNAEGDELTVVMEHCMSPGDPEYVKLKMSDVTDPAAVDRLKADRLEREQTAARLQDELTRQRDEKAFEALRQKLGK